MTACIACIAPWLIVGLAWITNMILILRKCRCGCEKDNNKRWWKIKCEETKQNEDTTDG